MGLIIQKHANITKMLILFVIICILNCVDGSIKCPSSGGASGTNAVSGSIFKFGDPVIFVTTGSQHYSPYSLVDVHRRTSVEEEYLMVGYTEIHSHKDLAHLKIEHLTMLVYDGGRNIKTKASENPDLVHQNLEKGLYWRFFNSTGISPSVTIVNTTTRITIHFHVHKHHHGQPTDISFYAILSTREFFREPQVPYMAIFEMPANTRVLRQTKTMIQYQSFSLWRWKLSGTVMDWSNITSISDPMDISTVTSNFQRIDNPCIRDMFLLYVPRKHKTDGDALVYLASPLIQSHLDENWFYDMKTPDHPWWPDEPETMVLTNDHLVVLTSNAMWISYSLNDSSNLDIDLEMNGAYEDRPILTYKLANPCERFGDGLDCFVSANTIFPGNVTISTSERLFYTPVCYLIQFPFYDDTLIFTVERNTTYEDGEQIIDFSVLYAPSPYRERDWKVLFSNVVYYKLFQQSADGVTHMKRHVFIKRIVGIFFNHHLRQFDITLELNYTSPKYVRFVLPEPTTVFDGYGALLSKTDKMKAHAANNHRKKLRQLNGTVGNGFLQFDFPKSFEIDNVQVNGENMDVFFLGNQLWIAEGAGPFVYVSMAGFPRLENDTLCSPHIGSTSIIKQCSFNHPDKAYVCTNEDQRLIFAGKIGIKYIPTPVRVDEIAELANAQRVNPWPSKYFCELVQNRGVFVAGYSGRILFWYLHEPTDESTALQQAISSGCSQPETEPILCDDIKDWQSGGCNAEPLGKTGFRMIAIDSSRLKPIKRSTDGPLVPFLVDSNTAVLYEVIVPTPEDDPNNTLTYFRDVHLGQTILCLDYELQKTDGKDVSLRHSCQLFIRHIKPVESYLDGFKSILYVTILNSIPLHPLPADVVVLVQAHSNMALVKINDYLNNPKWDFEDDHIGQTLYIPGNFSIFLTGFPFENDKAVMEGYTTRYFHFEERFVFRAFFIFLMDMSTKRYRDTQISQALDVINRTKSRWSEIDKMRSEELQAEIDMRQRIEERWMKSPFAEKDGSGNVVPVFKNPPPVIDNRETVENELLEITINETINLSGQPHTWVPRQLPNPDSLVHGNVPYKDRRIWHVLETQCHYVMSLVHNPVLKTSGGRISLDIYDRISFEVLLRPISSLATLLMYRPIIEVTNTNPDVLRVEKVEKLKGAPQFFQLLLAPTGFKKGVAVITVRSLVTSVHCAHSSSVTFIVLCHRDVGRRLHVEYPIPSCKPKEEDGMYPRPWYTQVGGCIRSEEILDAKKKEIVRDIDDRTLTAYITLPTNYRPPSFDGADIPNTRNVYNADPSKPMYKTWYKISRETLELNRCEGKKTKAHCNCTKLDRLLDDEELTECKEKVFSTKRTGTGDPIVMVISYDRIMQDSDQNPEIFLRKTNWSVTIEEVNGRGEWYIVSDYSPYINMINTNKKLHRGRRHYDMNKLYITLLGTGLFHFKVKLGPFESFSDVTGYFMLYASTDDINHVHLFMILLGTIIFCLTMVFIGFMANRKRLSSMLPIQPMSHKRKLKHLLGQPETTVQMRKFCEKHC